MRPGFVATSLVLLIAGCGGEDLVLPGEGEAASIVVVAGDAQSGRVGEELAGPLVVQVNDTRGQPVAGATVVLDLASPGGNVEPDTVVTGADGRASARLRLGTEVGAATGEARVVTPPEARPIKTSFTVTALPANASGLTAVSGGDQSAPAGSVLPEPLVVRVTDVFGNAVEGVTVTWTAQGGGSVSVTSAVTDAAGYSSVTRTLGATAGRQTTEARADGLAGSPVVFGHVATPGPASALAVRIQPPATASVGTTFTRQPVIQLRDASGNEVAQDGVAVTAAVASGAGTLGGTATRVTDGSGQATFTDLRLNGAVGSHTLIFAAGGYTSVASQPIDVQRASSATRIDGDTPDPSAPGEAVLVRFTVTSSAGTPGGSVRVTVTGGNEGCTGTVAAASCSIVLTATGDRTLTATFDGGTLFTGSSDTEGHQVNAPNGSPTAGDDQYATNEGAALSVPAPGVLANDTDPEGSPLQASLVAAPANGQVSLAPDGSFTYAPAADFFGDDSFTYTASDGSASSGAATVRMTVRPVNDAPSFQAGPDQSAPALGGPQTVTGWATAISPGPTNENDQTVEFVVAVSSGSELFLVAPAISPNGTLTYTPAGGEGTATASVVIRDSGGIDNGGVDTSVAQELSITLTP